MSALGLSILAAVDAADRWAGVRRPRVTMLECAIDQDLALLAGIFAIENAERELLAKVPPGATIQTTHRAIAGALMLVLASGVIVVTQYRMRFDDHVVYARLYYTEKEDRGDGCRLKT